MTVAFIGGIVFTVMVGFLYLKFTKQRVILQPDG